MKTPHRIRVVTNNPLVRDVLGEYYKIEVEDYDSEVTAVNQERIQLAVQSNMPLNDVPLVEAEWFIDTYWYIIMSYHI